jgi:hypothetical protein
MRRRGTGPVSLPERLGGRDAAAAGWPALPPGWVSRRALPATAAGGNGEPVGGTRLGPQAAGCARARTLPIPAAAPVRARGPRSRPAGRPRRLRPAEPTSPEPSTVNPGASAIGPAAPVRISSSGTSTRVGVTGELPPPWIRGACAKTFMTAISAPGSSGSSLPGAPGRYPRMERQLESGLLVRARDVDAEARSCAVRRRHRTPIGKSGRSSPARRPPAVTV